MERREVYLVITMIVAVWIFVILTLFCYCPFLGPIDVLIPFKAVVIIGGLFWITISVLFFRNGKIHKNWGIRKLTSLLSFIFFTSMFIVFLTQFGYTVHVAIPKNENILFCWMFGSIVIIFGMFVLTYNSIKNVTRRI